MIIKRKIKESRIGNEGFLYKIILEATKSPEIGHEADIVKSDIFYQLHKTPDLLNHLGIQFNKLEMKYNFDHWEVVTSVFNYTEDDDDL